MCRKEITKSKAQQYNRASKKEKGKILNELCNTTGWRRDNARKSLKRALHKDYFTKKRKKENVNILLNQDKYLLMCRRFLVVHVENTLFIR